MHMLELKWSNSCVHWHILLLQHRVCLAWVDRNVIMCRRKTSSAVPRTVPSGQLRRSLSTCCPPTTTTMYRPTHSPGWSTVTNAHRTAAVAYENSTPLFTVNGVMSVLDSVRRAIILYNSLRLCLRGSPTARLGAFLFIRSFVHSLAPPKHRVMWQGLSVCLFVHWIIPKAMNGFL